MLREGAILGRAGHQVGRPRHESGRILVPARQDALRHTVQAHHAHRPRRRSALVLYAEERGRVAHQHVRLESRQHPLQQADPRVVDAQHIGDEPDDRGCVFGLVTPREHGPRALFDAFEPALHLLQHAQARKQSAPRLLRAGHFAIEFRGLDPQLLELGVIGRQRGGELGRAGLQFREAPLEGRDLVGDARALDLNFALARREALHLGAQALLLLVDVALLVLQQRHTPHGFERGVSLALQGLSRRCGALGEALAVGLHRGDARRGVLLGER